MEDGLNLSCEIFFCLTGIQGISEVRLLIHPLLKIGAWISTLSSMYGSCHMLTELIYLHKL